MFGIGPLELVVIAVVALIAVGPERLPHLMRQIGKYFVHVRRYSSSIRNEINEVMRSAENEIRMEEARKLREEIQKELRDAGKPLPPAEEPPVLKPIHSQPVGFDADLSFQAESSPQAKNEEKPQ